MATVRIGVAGAGRMGQAIAAMVAAADDLELAGNWRRGDELRALVDASDVLIDFTLPEATETVVGAVRDSGTPLVCGVSGLGQAERMLLASAAEALPVVYDRNMSMGVAVLENLVRAAAAALGAGFDIEIRETHHVHKKDAPSGTALKLGEAVAQVQGTDADAIRYVSERRGEVPGDHAVVFDSPNERLSLDHSVTTRDVFAAGAVRAARWVAGRPPGLYTMQDVLGL